MNQPIQTPKGRRSSQQAPHDAISGAPEAGNRLGYVANWLSSRGIALFALLVVGLLIMTPSITAQPSPSTTSLNPVSYESGQNLEVIGQIGGSTEAVPSSIASAMSRRADLIVLEQFNPGQGGLVSVGFDSTTDHVWVYGGFDADLHSYTRTGDFLSSVERPGESADDADIEFAPEAFTLGSTAIESGTMLFINGESGTADIYAVNSQTGTIIATLNTSFGVSHVVGGAYHPERNTFFLVQDSVPGTADENRIAEVDPQTGEVLNTFQITDLFSVFYGDIDVSPTTGNLFVVSSRESRIIELSPTGTLVQYFDLPAGVGSLSGIGFENAGHEAWVSGTGGTVWRLGGFPSDGTGQLKLYLPTIMG